MLFSSIFRIRKRLQKYVNINVNLIHFQLVGFFILSEFCQFSNVIFFRRKKTYKIF